jgi:molybdate transport system substrate-binding protein
MVSAAATLTDVFQDIKITFEQANPGVEVVLNFGASGALYRQIAQGAPMDVFASADVTWMQRAVDAGMVDGDHVHVFARNTIVLAVPADNPAGVEALADLKNESVQRIGISTPDTSPAGRYAKTALEAQEMYAALEPRLIFGETVRQILDYLVRGEVDCGFVFRTDALKTGVAVPIVEEIPLAEPVLYPVAVLKDAPSPDIARAFVDFLGSETGLRLLEARGFMRP